MIWIVLCFVVPLWYMWVQRHKAPVSRNPQRRVGVAWEQDTPWVLDLGDDNEEDV